VSASSDIPSISIDHTDWLYSSDYISIKCSKCH